MFQPRFTYTAEIKTALEKIEDIRVLVDHIPIMPPWESELRRTALINTVHYSTKVEGNVLNWERVERLLTGHGVAGSERY